MRILVLLFAALTLFAGVLGGCSSTEDTQSASAPDTEEATEEDSGQSADAELEGELQVHAAASLKAAFDELTELFAEENPKVAVAPTVYDGSSVLAVQIDEGAPTNVFASADIANMDKVVEKDLIDGEPVIFATNELTIAVAPGNPKGVQGAESLTDPDLTVVLCEDEVPCGAVGAQILEALGLEVTPMSKEQNVTAVATKVASGEADAGLIYVTDVAVSDGAVEGVPITNSAEFATSYPIAVVKNGGDEQVAQAFIDLVLSDRGQQVLADFGFQPAPN